jgi:Zn-dependent protease with chaperone function
MPRCYALLLTLGVACAAAPPAPHVPAAVPHPAAGSDPVNTAHLPTLRAIAQRTFDELLTLHPRRRRVRLVIENMHDDVNAYATCTANGEPMVAVTETLLVVGAHVAMSRATDERFETDRLRALARHLATHRGMPGPAFYDAAMHADGRKLARQRQLYEEMLAYVLGHELAHHRLGQLRCENGGVVIGVGHIAARAIPLFSQAAETAADVAAIKYVLEAGRRRAGYGWGEEGALALLEFVGRRDATSVGDALASFLHSHPLPAVRIGLVTFTAELWRSSGGFLPP